MVNSAPAQKNMVLNGGFEDEFFGWNNNGAMQTPYNLKSGKYSCAIVTHNTGNWVGIDQIVEIPKKVQNIMFSAWIATTNVVKGKDDWDGAIFTVVFLDSQDKEMKDGVNIAQITGTNDWTFYKKTIKMPDKAYSFKILVAMGNASGTMLVDDVSAVKVE
ncbi:hypothetical protein MgSA37_03680 [Mucilaginibacter gotjawali]|nr:hypothetical protein MgSA37_03680 [Mucilaginibacter gotjawali]